MTPNNNLNPLAFYKSQNDMFRARPYNYGIKYPLYMPLNRVTPFQIIRGLSESTTLTSAKIYNDRGVEVATVTSYMSVNVVTIGASKVMQFKCGNYANLTPGQYTMRVVIGNDTYYSEVFTAYANIGKLVKVEYYNADPIIFDEGALTYDNGFKFELYLCTEIAKPEYLFEEESTKRGGFTFVENQISSKQYKMVIAAPEYLCDAIRIIRLHDHVAITKDGNAYEAYNFTPSYQWNDVGDLAQVTITFESNTVLQKISAYKGSQSVFKNALLAAASVPIMFSPNVIAQYGASVDGVAEAYTEFTGKLIRQLEEQTTLPKEAWVAIDTGTGEAKKMSIGLLGGGTGKPSELWTNDKKIKYLYIKEDNSEAYITKQFIGDSNIMAKGDIVAYQSGNWDLVTPTAGYDTLGMARFNSSDFTIDNGLVGLKVGAVGQRYYAGKGLSLASINGGTDNQFNVVFGELENTVMQGNDARFLKLYNGTWWGQAFDKSTGIVKGAMTSVDSINTLVYFNTDKSILVTKNKSAEGIKFSGGNSINGVYGSATNNLYLNYTDATHNVKIDANHNIFANGDIVAYASGNYDISKPLAGYDAVGMSRYDKTQFEVVNGLVRIIDSGGGGTIAGIEITGNGNAFTNASMKSDNTVISFDKGITFWHAGNDGNGSGLDADLLDGWHRDDIRQRVKSFAVYGANSDGFYDADIAADGGMIRNYDNYTKWTNTPSGMTYGAAICFKAYNSSSLFGMLAWDINHESTTDVTRKLYWRTNGTVNGVIGTWGKWHEVAFADGNVASATKLQTMRTIWGKSFNGSADVKGVISSSGTAEDAFNLMSTKTNVRGRIGKDTSNYNCLELTYNHAADDSQGNYLSLGWYGATTTHMFYGKFNGNWGIGTNSPVDKLEVVGAITANDIYPRLNNSYSVGYSSRRFNNGYFTQAIYIGDINTNNNSGSNNALVSRGYIELNHVNPYIDFHYNNSTSDYTHRIIAYNGRFEITPSISIGGSCYPTNSTTCMLGTSSLRWVRLYLTGINGNWISGKTDGAIMIDSTSTSTSTYFPLYRWKTYTGRVFNLGGLQGSDSGHQFGFYMFDKNQTENRTNASFYMYSNGNMNGTHSLIMQQDVVAYGSSSYNITSPTAGYDALGLARFDSTYFTIDNGLVGLKVGAVGQRYYAGKGLSLASINGGTDNQFNVVFGELENTVMQGNDARFLKLYNGTWWGQAFDKSTGIVKGAMTSVDSINTLVYFNTDKSILVTKNKSAEGIKFSGGNSINGVYGSATNNLYLNYTDATHNVKIDANHNIFANGDIVAYASGNYDISKPLAGYDAVGMSRYDKTQFEVVNGLVRIIDSGGGGTIAGIEITGNGNAFTNASMKSDNTVISFDKGITFWHAGNDGNGSGLDADLLDGWHRDDIRQRVKSFAVYGANSDGFYDADIAADGGMIRNYDNYTKWTNTPSGMTYGAAICFKAYNSSSLFGMLAWDINHESTTDVTRKLYWRTNGTVNGVIGTWGKWHEVAFADGNVASATKLQTMRTIWGKSFNGSADVKGVISSSGTAEDAFNLMSTKTNVRGRIGKDTSNYNCLELTYNHAADDSQGNYLSLGWYGATTTHMFYGKFNGNWGIGTNSPVDKLEVVGAITANDIYPRLNNSYSVGYSSRRFNNGYFTQAIYIGDINTNNNSGSNNALVSRGYIELNHVNPYIDFHYNNSTSDYTHRIIAYNGRFEITPSISIGGSCYPTNSTTCMLGTSSLRWVRLYLTGINGNWISGKTDGAIMIDSTSTSTSTYFPLYRWKTYTGRVFNLGGLQGSDSGHQFGFYMFDKNQTENRTNASFYMYSNGNMNGTHSLIMQQDVVAYGSSSYNITSPTAGYDALGLARFDSTYFTVSSGYVTLKASATSPIRSVTATTLNPGSNANASWNSSTGALSLGIPRGNTGATGKQGESVTYQWSGTSLRMGVTPYGGSTSWGSYVNLKGATGSPGPTWNGGTITNNLIISPPSDYAKITLKRDSIDYSIYCDGKSMCFSKWSTQLGYLSGSGVFHSVGGFVNDSDIRKKIRLENVTGILNKLSDISAFYYVRRDNVEEIKKVHVGLSAQEILSILPEVVYDNYDNATNVKYYSLDYATLGAVIAVNGLKEVQQLVQDNKNEIDLLKIEIASLKERLAKLEAA